MTWKQQLENEFKERCFFNKPLAPFTTYKIGGPASALVYPQTINEWNFLLKLSKEEEIPLSVLGLGSNVLISDKGLDAIVALTTKMDKVLVTKNKLTALAGATWDNVVSETISYSLSGLECTSGIPGTVGGAVHMNAGAYGQETFDKLTSITVIDRNCNMITLPKEKIEHGYREVKGISDLIILSAEWVLEKGDKQKLLEKRNEILKKRSQNQPLEYPSAGSVFKRPVGTYASQLIDECKLKGLTVGKAQVSTKHAGFIINLGGATSADVCKLIKKVKQEVKEKTGIDLELEQILLGKF
jgi:UDP-N-acetylmuramate dehydrogenase